MDVKWPRVLVIVVVLSQALSHGLAGQEQRAVPLALRAHAIGLALASRTVELEDTTAVIDACGIYELLDRDSAAFEHARDWNWPLSGISRALDPKQCGATVFGPGSRPSVRVDSVVQSQPDRIAVYMIRHFHGSRAEEYILGRGGAGAFVLGEIRLRRTLPGNDRQELVPPRDPPTQPISCTLDDCVDDRSVGSE